MKKIIALLSILSSTSVFAASGPAPVEKVDAKVPCYEVASLAQYIINVQGEKVVFEGSSQFTLDGTSSPVFVLTYNSTSKEYTALVEYADKVCVYDFGKGKFDLGAVLGVGNTVMVQQ